MPTPQYGDYQWDIYEDGLKGKLPRFPVDYASLERAAAEVLPSWVYSYVGYGAGDGSTQQANIDAFSRYWIVPRMLGAWVSNTPSGVSCWRPDTRDDGVWLMISMMVGCSR